MLELDFNGCSASTFCGIASTISILALGKMSDVVTVHSPSKAPTSTICTGLKPRLRNLSRLTNISGTPTFRFRYSFALPVSSLFTMLISCGLILFYKATNNRLSLLYCCIFAPLFFLSAACQVCVLCPQLLPFPLQMCIQNH